MYQDTIYNAYSNGESVSYNWSQCAQCSIVQVVQNGMGPAAQQIGTFVNFSGYAGYPYSGNAFNNLYYQAVIGSHFDGGTTYYNTNAETVRVSACAYCYIANNDFLNAGPSYAQLKVHQGNNYSNLATWIGQYTQYDEISDNYFGGTSGANAVEIAPENSQDDERMRYIVLERNVWGATAPGGRDLEISGVNITARDNAFELSSTTAYGIQICQRGIEPAPQGVEIYNNTLYAPSGSSNVAAIEVSSNSCGGAANPSNSYIKNNLAYFPSQNGLPVVDNGGGITASNNTAAIATNPSFSMAAAR